MKVLMIVELFYSSQDLKSYIKNNHQLIIKCNLTMLKVKSHLIH